MEKQRRLQGCRSCGVAGPCQASFYLPCTDNRWKARMPVSAGPGDRDMHRMQRDCLIAGFLVSILLGVQPSEAQYTANFQTNIISGVTSNWPSSYYVGFTNF